MTYNVDIPLNCNWGEMAIWVQKTLDGGWDICQVILVILLLLLKKIRSNSY